MPEPILSHDFFYAAYIARLKAGEILPDWEPSSDVEYLVRELNHPKEREADSLRQHNVPDEEVAQIKFACTLLMRFYNRIRHILINDEDASAYYRSMQPEDRFQAEVNILFHVITAQEMFAFSQAVYAGVQAHRNIPMLQALLEIPSYIDKLESVSLHECMHHLYIVSAFRTMYLKTCPLDEKVERSINEFLGDYFRIYTDLRKEQISKEIFHSKFSYKKPSDTVCINRIYSESKSAIEAISSDSSVPASDLELCHLYLDYLRDEYGVASTDVPTPKKATRKANTVVKNRSFTTFQPNGINPGHITLFYQKLMDLNWIPKDTPADEFQKLFSGRSCVCRITWTGGGIDNLYELFSQIKNQELITIPGDVGLEAVLSNHFTNPKGHYLSVHNSGKPAKKVLPKIKECIDLLQTSLDLDQ